MTTDKQALVRHAVLLFYLFTSVYSRVFSFTGILWNNSNPKCMYIKIEVSVYTEFILVRLCNKLFRNTLESILGTNQYWTMSVQFLAQGNNDLPLLLHLKPCIKQSLDYLLEVLTTQPCRHPNRNFIDLSLFYIMFIICFLRG